MTKKCFKCLLTKDISQFYKHSKMADGHLNKCKDCTKLDVKKRLEIPEALEKRIQYQKEYWQKNKKTEHLIQQKRRNRVKDETKYKARTAVVNAVRDGRLKKLPCEVCQNVKSEGHHPDYRSPLKVIWLCRKHHLEAHGKKAY